MRNMSFRELKFVGIVIATCIALFLLAGLACCGKGSIAGSSIDSQYTSKLVLPDSYAADPHEETSVPDNVASEIADYPTPDSVDAEMFAKLREELLRLISERAAAGEKISASAPAGDSGRVADLSYNGETEILTWSYINLGDYDLGGEVGISDITPIAQNYLADTGDGEGNDSLERWIDGSGNGEVGIEDITRIAENYLNDIAGYNVYGSETVDGGWQSIGDIAFNDHITEGSLLSFSFDASETYYTYYQVVPYDSLGDEGEPSNPERRDEFTFDVTWDPQTTFVDEDNLNLIVDADPETHTYTFDKAGATEAGLDISEGRVVLIYGDSVRRITTITDTGTELVAETEFAALTDAISDGTIAWDYGVDFSPEKVTSVTFGDRTISADEPLEFEYESGGYTYTLSFLLLDQKAEATLTVSKGIGENVTGKFVLSGNIESFRSVDDIRIEGSQTQQFDSDFEGMRGQLTLELIATASGDASFALELPWVILRVPFMVGPIPVVLKIKVMFVTGLHVPLGGSSWVKVVFDYDSDIGFTYNGTDVGASGNIGGYAFGKEEAQTGGASVVEANFGVAFPRVELSMLGEILVPFAHTAFLVEGYFKPAFPALQEAKARYIGAIGYEFELLGYDLGGYLTLFDEEEIIYQAGETPCL